MNEDMFIFLESMIILLEKYNPKNMQMIIEIVETCEKELTLEQKALVLKRMMIFARPDEKSGILTKAEEDWTMDELNSSRLYY